MAGDITSLWIFDSRKLQAIAIQGAGRALTSTLGAALVALLSVAKGSLEM